MKLSRLNLRKASNLTFKNLVEAISTQIAAVTRPKPQQNNQFLPKQNCFDSNQFRDKFER